MAKNYRKIVEKIQVITYFPPQKKFVLEFPEESDQKDYEGTQNAIRTLNLNPVRC